MKVLITGGTGFVGSHLVPYLLNKGFKCRLLTRDMSAARKRYPKGIEIFQGDLIDPDSLNGLMKGITHVIHMAAFGHVSAISEEAYYNFVNVNVYGTKNLLRACVKEKIERFVHFSSTAAMGLIRKNGPVNEDDLPVPRTPYQKSKLESEQVALKTGRELGIPVVVLRPCMIYGKGENTEFQKMAILMRKSLFPKVGRGQNLTPLVHAYDVVQAALAAMQHGQPGEVYLIASNKSLPMDELRAMVMEAWDSRAFYPYFPVWFMLFLAWGIELFAKMTGSTPIVTRSNISNTIWDREFSIKKACSELGYEPSISFADGINETVDWYRKLLFCHSVSKLNLG